MDGLTKQQAKALDAYIENRVKMLLRKAKMMKGGAINGF